MKFDFASEELQPQSPLLIDTLKPLTYKKYIKLSSVTISRL